MNLKVIDKLLFEITILYLMKKYSTSLSLSFSSTTHKMPVFPILANFKAESFAR